MTEAEWLECADPQKMLYSFLWDRITDRRRRLFACACCRQVWHLLIDSRSQRVVEATEQYVDGKMGKDQLVAAQSEARMAQAELVRKCDETADTAPVVLQYEFHSIPPEYHKVGTEWLFLTALCSAAEAAIKCAAESMMHHRAHNEAAWAAAKEKQVVGRNLNCRETDYFAERCKNDASILRHIVGNPFRPYPVPDRWPATVVQLADALYNGQDCGFALHDALLDAGHSDLPQHFREERVHPKGCWVLDLLLGKE